MLDKEAKKMAEPFVKAVVDCIADKRYEELPEYADFEDGLSLELFKELAEGFLKINELPYYDGFEYCRLHVYLYNDGTGFAVDYDFTTDNGLNDLTLQMDFRFTESDKMKVSITDAHVL